MAKRLGKSKRAEMLEVQDFDVSTFFSVIILTVAGFFAIYSATYAAQMNDRFSQQLVFGGVGLVVLLTAALIPARWFSIASYPLYLFSLALLTFVAFEGKIVAGQRSWIEIGSLQFQPSEIAKLATILVVAKFLSGDRKINKPFNFVVTCVLVLIPVALIMLEPDPGSAMVYAARSE